MRWLNNLLIRDESRQWIRAYAVEPSPTEADRAAAALRADYERWPRWILGVVSYIVAAGGAFFSLWFIGVWLTWPHPVPPDEAFFIGTLIVVGAAGAVAALFVLHALWRTGRELTRGAAAWIRLPYDTGVREPGTAARWRAFFTAWEPRMMVRVLNQSVTFLVVVLAAALLVREILAGGTPFIPAVVAVLLISLACGCGQAAGTWRIVLALQHGDPGYRRYWR